MTHELKTWPEGFAAILDGRKRFEIRKADRPFDVGDTLHLREWNPDGSGYTGRETAAQVTYLVRGGAWGLPPDLCVMGIAAPSSPAKGEAQRASCACGGSMRDAGHGTHSCTPIRRDERGVIVLPLPGGEAAISYASPAPEPAKGEARNPVIAQCKASLDRDRSPSPTTGSET
jgi:hypothetical protein